MPPIPVHIDDPIAPQKGTSAPSNASPAVDATATSSIAQSAYPPARPGAAAVPAPTSYIPNPQPQPTRTTGASLNQNAPPPPQPGAVPVPPTQQFPMTAASGLPPPPMAGQTLPHAPLLNQMNMPPIQQNYAPTHSTTTTTAGPPPSLPATTQRSGPTTLNFGPVSSPGVGSQYLTAPSAVGAGGPPGYQQNIYAQEMSSAQRASLDEQARRENVTAGLGFGGMGGDGSANEAAGNVWNTVKGWASVAGNKLAETEHEVWKRING